MSVAFASVDSSSLNEIISSIEINSKDSSSLIEGTQTTLTSKDASVFSELTSSASANVSSRESSSLLEIINNITLLTKDSSTLEEFDKTIDNNSKDIFFLLSELNSISDLKLGNDSISFKESISNTGLNVFQLISFKEGKVGIRKAAPLIFNVNGNPTTHGTVTGGSIGFNINDNPTVHGTVTGNAITIVLSGGTVPILL
jgi:hypothetical protein